ncbi:MAG: TIGR03087 family PEP-CTERM/XrtA system glycosyltransferase [Phycisphaerae bacterium]
MNRRRNILFLTNRLPYPPDKGDKIRTCHQLEHLAASHDVCCACFVDSAEDLALLPELNRRCRSAAAVRWQPLPAVIRGAQGWLRGGSITTAAYRDRTMFDRLARWTARIRFDAVVAFSSTMAPYALAVPAARRVLDMCDVDSEKWSDYARTGRPGWSALCRSEARRLRALEQSCLERFDATILITPRERRLLDPTETMGRLHVIPNGVDLPRGPFTPASKRGPVVGFLGSMDYRPNVEGIDWFVRRVWPGVLRELPEARLWIVGRNPTRRVRGLARTRGVTVTGTVRDARAYLARCRVVVAPLHVARGMQNKVLEAMASRRPVVATSAVAGGLRVRNRHNILVADAPDRFRMRVVDLCRFETLCDEIAEAGYRHVAAHYCWPEVLQRYERLILGPSRPAARKLPVSAIGRPSAVVRDRIRGLTYAPPGGSEAAQGRRAGAVRPVQTPPAPTAP